MIGVASGRQCRHGAAHVQWRTEELRQASEAGKDADSLIAFGKARAAAQMPRTYFADRFEMRPRPVRKLKTLGANLGHDVGYRERQFYWGLIPRLTMLGEGAADIPLKPTHVVRETTALWKQEVAVRLTKANR